MSSYTQKIIEVRVTLAEGNFAASKNNAGNTKIIRLACDVVINKPGGKEKPSATIKVYNLPLADMEQLTLLAFKPLKSSKNVVAVYAGDENGLSLAFSGDITGAVPDFSGSPEPIFEITAITGYQASITAVSPYTAKGEQDVPTTLQKLVKDMGFTFQNRGAVAKMRNLALMGGPLEQARALAEAARLDLILDDSEIIITPRGTLRTDATAQNTPVWTAASGLLGYPAFDNKGIIARGIYEPRLLLGGPLRIESMVPRATGLWKITSLSHHLQAGLPRGGAWESSVKAAYVGE